MVDSLCCESILNNFGCVSSAIDSNIARSRAKDTYYSRALAEALITLEDPNKAYQNFPPGAAIEAG